jgi:MerR family copper efflux transcriptional regulator
MDYTPLSRRDFSIFMLIGELARKAGLSKDTVRYYQRAGLIHAGEKPAGTRVYKTFDEQALERLIFIKGGQAGGWTLREIKDTLDTWGTDMDAIPREQMIRQLEEKLVSIDEKLKHLQAVRDYVVRKMEVARSGESFVAIKPRLTGR